MSKISVEDLQKIIAGATGGPWSVSSEHFDEYSVLSPSDYPVCDIRKWDDEIDSYDAQFIAASRQALPAALRVIALAKEALKSCDYDYQGELKYSEGDVREALSAIEAFENEVTK